MRKIIDICDRCGNEGGDSWDDKVIHFEFKLPLDGVNGGEFKMDLCRNCREEFWTRLGTFEKDAPRPLAGIQKTPSEAPPKTEANPCHYTDAGLECRGCNWKGCEHSAIPKGLARWACPECGERCIHPLRNFNDPQGTPCTPPEETGGKTATPG